jgi:hypothetical protein
MLLQKGFLNHSLAKVHAHFKRHKKQENEAAPKHAVHILLACHLCFKFFSI